MIEEDRCGIFRYRYRGRRTVKSPGAIITKKNTRYFDSVAVSCDGKVTYMTVPKVDNNRYQLRYRY